MSSEALAVKASLIERARGFFSRVLGRERAPAIETAPRVDSAAMQRYYDYFTTQKDRLAHSLARGDITVDAWRDAMAREIEQLHVTADVIGRGGLDAYSASDLKRVGNQIESELKYLNRWAGGLREMPEISETAVANRGRLYGEAATETLQRATTARMGMPTLPFYPKDRTICKRNCKCGWEIKRLTEGDYDVFWRRHAEDSCETCIRRGQVCNPLRIRGGNIESIDMTGLIAR